jgi:hypothetical protein
MKNIPQINNRSNKQRNYKGTEAFLIGRKPVLFVNFDQFPCSWILIRIPNTDPDRQYYIYFLQTEKSGGVVEKRRSAARECVAQPEWLERLTTKVATGSWVRSQHPPTQWNLRGGR